MDEADAMFQQPELRDDEAPSDEDLARAEQAVDRQCPACAQELYEDAVICPACGTALEETSASIWAGRSWWWLTLAVVGAAALVAVLVASF